MQQSIDGIVRYIIPGNPIPLARPRLVGKIVYDSQKKLKRKIWELLILLHGNNPQYEGALHLSIVFFMKKPKGKKLENWHQKRPDLSNMIKFYEDVASGIIFKDDAQIAKITASKVYDNVPRVEFTITSLNE